MGPEGGMRGGAGGGVGSGGAWVCSRRMACFMAALVATAAAAQAPRQPSLYARLRTIMRSQAPRGLVTSLTVEPRRPRAA